MGTWFNQDGLEVNFDKSIGVRGDKAGTTQSNSKEQELVLFVTLTGAARTIYTADRNNDGTLDGFSQKDGFLPANALITEQKVIEIIAPAGGTNYAVGTYALNGTVDDADGIRTTLGADGAQVGTKMSARKNVGVVTTGTYTAGKIKIVVRYLIP